jgi:hypothetical protein
MTNDVSDLDRGGTDDAADMACQPLDSLPVAGVNESPDPIFPGCGFGIKRRQRETGDADPIKKTAEHRMHVARV